MTHPNEILLEATKLQLLAAALELQRATSTSAHVLPIPGTDRSIAIGTPAEVGPLLGIAAAPAVAREATAQGEQVSDDELVRFCPHCASIGEVGEEYRDCCPDGSTARHIPKHLAEVCRNTFKLAIGSIGAPAKPMTSEEERAEAAKKSDWCPHCGQGWHCASQLATTPSRAAADEVRDAALDEVADHLEALSDSCGDAAARDQREMNLYEEERMHAIQHCANVVRGLKRANDTGEQA